MLLLIGCGSHLKTINTANEVARALWVATAPAFDSRCMARINECKAAGVTVSEKCARWVACRDARRAFFGAIGAVHLKASVAASAELLGKKPDLAAVVDVVLAELDKARKLALTAGAL